VSEVTRSAGSIVAARPKSASEWRPRVFGAAFCGVIAAAGFALRQAPGFSSFSPMILSILLGIAFHNLAGTPAVAKPGVTFAARRILRVGIVLLGFQLTAAQIAQVGFAGIGVVVCSVVGCFAFTAWAGRKIGVEPKLTELIAAGTSICGASAVIATNAVTQASEEDTAYAVVCVTGFGTLAMFLYPALATLLQLDPRSYGLWAGASIHEVAQVVAASYQHGKSAGDYGTITKLTRVMMLAPVVIALGALAARRVRAGGMGIAKAPVPWFVVGFLAAAGVNSVAVIPALSKSIIVSVTTFLLSVALAALGLETDLAKVWAKGIRPLLLGAAATLFIGVLALGLVTLAS
jgi:uncharacterized integral membrane protein (TIGR00698 family)